jgi:dsRNA-specific ribonuclease
MSVVIEPLAAFEARIQYNFRHPELLERAMTHKSY